ncbi:MAG: pyrimidine-nucleoside phosphorylase [Clostridia bacterium]|nr:pyrimidine-nucleoside phosphorylase [Clostridia bacterium]
MRMLDIITKKRDGNALTKEEIDFFVTGYVKSEIPDYQVAALLMAIYFKGLSEPETINLTLAMANSGEKVDLSMIPGIKIDKHSTGGVGDKTTLIVAPIVASLGVFVPKMSGRGLGFTGGTIDKLDSIPNLQTSMPIDAFVDIVKEVGFSDIGQSENLVPADKKIYSLRDVTATVESLPLIASSIMSKKIASGADCILLDVKCGSGAFMNTLDDSIELAKIMVKIGEHFGKKTVALVTNMDSPLGNAIGNSIEIVEACETLKGKGPSDLTELSIELAANMLNLAGKGSLESCKLMAKRAIADGSAFEKLKAMVKAQNGDISCLEDYSKFSKAKFQYHVKAKSSGFINKIDAKLCGEAAKILGAGRQKKDEKIDCSAGIILHKKVGDRIDSGETIATLYSSSLEKQNDAIKVFSNCTLINDNLNQTFPLIYAKVTSAGIEKF